MMDELSYCIRQPCKWRHSSEKKKKKQKNKCGGTETAGKGGRGHCTPWKYAKAGGVPTFP